MEYGGSGRPLTQKTPHNHGIVIVQYLQYYTGCITQISDIYKCSFSLKSSDYRELWSYTQCTLLYAQWTLLLVTVVSLDGFVTNIFIVRYRYIFHCKSIYLYILLRIYPHKNNNNKQVIISRQIFLSVTNSRVE